MDSRLRGNDVAQKTQFETALEVHVVAGAAALLERKIDFCRHDLNTKEEPSTFSEQASYGITRRAAHQAQLVIRLVISQLMYVTSKNRRLASGDALHKALYLLRV